MTELLAGRGSLGELAMRMERDRRALLLLHGSSSYRASGAERVLHDVTDRDHVRTMVVEGPLPSSAVCRQILTEMRPFEPDVVLGVGGGLVIDVMKVVAASVGSGVDPLRLPEGPDSPMTSVETIAVPTTAGSGSERTPFAVMYVDGVKRSVDHPRLLPDVAVLDPGLLASLPSATAASAGIDAIAHCIESIWSRGATPDSIEIASAALPSLWGHILGVSAGDPESLEPMSLASSDAGAAIAITRTTACHALSYHLTARHGLSHGHAVALTLAATFEFNLAEARRPDAAPELAENLQMISELVGAETVETTPSALRTRIGELGLKTTVGEAVGHEVDLDAWSSEVNPERLGNHPVPMTHSDIRYLMETSL